MNLLRFIFLGCNFLGFGVDFGFCRSGAELKARWPQQISGAATFDQNLLKRFAGMARRLRSFAAFNDLGLVVVFVVHIHVEILTKS